MALDIEEGQANHEGAQKITNMSALKRHAANENVNHHYQNKMHNLKA